MFSSPWSWLTIGCVLMVLEIIAPGVFLLWIGIATILVGLVASVWSDLSLALQFVVFAIAIVISVWGSLLLQRRRTLSSEQRILNSGMHSYVGRQALAITPFIQGHGRIQIDDSFYTAVSATPIQKGDTVRITGCENSLFFVEIITAGSAALP